MPWRLRHTEPFAYSYADPARDKHAVGHGTGADIVLCARRPLTPLSIPHFKQVLKSRGARPGTAFK